MNLEQVRDPETKTITFKCSCCGQIYNDLPLCFGSDYPAYYFSIPAEQREARVQLEESLCVIDNEHYFHRGRLTIPIHDHTEDLIFNVWTSISSENFNIREEMWNDPERIHNQPTFGWLQTQVPT